MYDIITLANGTRIGNFDISSKTEFMDKSVLPEIPMVLAHKLLLDNSEPSPTFKERLVEWERLHQEHKVDFVVVLNSTFRFLSANTSRRNIEASPFRRLYMRDRDNLIYSVEKTLTNEMAF